MRGILRCVFLIIEWNIVVKNLGGYYFGGEGIVLAREA